MPIRRSISFVTLSRRLLSRRAAAGWTAGAGAALLLYAALQPGAPAGVPGWQPVDDAVRRTIDSPEIAAFALGPRPTAVPAGDSASERPEAAASPPTPAPSASASPSPSAAAVTDGPLDLNAASAEALERLPGIGPAKARAIVDYRTSHGPFGSVDQLLEVKGIGPRLLERIRTLVAV